jgi:hypothetical protein
MQTEVMINKFQRQVEVITKHIPAQNIGWKKDKIVDDNEQYDDQEHCFQKRVFHGILISF